MTHQRLDNIIDIPHIGGGFNHHCIALTQGLPGPLAKLADLDPTRQQHPFLPGIHPACQNIFFVNVQCNIALDGSCPCVYFHATLLLGILDWDVDFWVRVAGTDSGLACLAIPEEVPPGVQLTQRAHSSHTRTRTTQTLLPQIRPWRTSLAQDTHLPRPFQVHPTNAHRWAVHFLSEGAAVRAQMEQIKRAKDSKLTICKETYNDKR